MLSKEVRHRVYAAIQSGQSLRSIQAATGVDPRTIRKIRERGPDYEDASQRFTDGDNAARYEPTLEEIEAACRELRHQAIEAMVASGDAEPIPQRPSIRMCSFYAEHPLAIRLYLEDAGLV